MLRISMEEGQRLVSVLHGAASTVRNIAALPVARDADFVSALTEVGGEDAALEAEALWKLEASLPDSLIDAGSSKVAVEHEVATRRTCRAIGALPSKAASILRERELGEGLEALADTLDGLIAVNKKLAMAPGASSHEVSADRPPTPDPETVAAIKLRQLRLDSDIETLEAEFKAVSTTRQTEVSALSGELEELSQELLRLQKSARAEQEALESKTAEVHEDVRTAHDTELEALHTELEKQASELDEKALTNLKEKATLRKRVVILEREVAKAIENYDTKMMEMQKEILQLEEANTEDGKTLSKLVEHFTLLDTNTNTANAEEAEFQRVLAERHEAKLAKETGAALPIQRMYRNVKAERERKEAEAKARKRGKGKGGKKKK